MASLSLLLPQERVLELDTADREAALGALVEAVARDSGLEPATLLAAVLEREALASTGFGGGLAMPHVRLPKVRRFELALGRTRAGVAFDALDGAPVHLLLLIVGPEGEREPYQKLMSRAARFLKTEGARLIACDDLVAETSAALVDH